MLLQKCLEKPRLVLLAEKITIVMEGAVIRKPLPEAHKAFSLHAVKLREKEVSINHLSYVMLEEAPKPETESVSQIVGGGGLPFGLPEESASP